MKRSNPFGRQPFDDKLTELSHRISQIKFIVFESVLLGLFFYALYKFARGEFGP
jgi:hypothetical protein